MNIKKDIFTLKAAIKKVKREMKTEEKDDGQGLPKRMDFEESQKNDKIQKLRKMLEKEKRVKKSEKQIRYTVDTHQITPFSEQLKHLIKEWKQFK